MTQAEKDALEQRLGRAIEAYHEAALLYAAVTLGLPGAMGAARWQAADLARALGLSAPHLARFLRGLCLIGICDERDGGGFALTDFGRSLTPDSRLARKVQIVVEQYWRPWAELAATLRTGTPAFATVFGASVVDWRRDHPEQGAMFAAYLANETQAETASILAALDVAETDRLVEIDSAAARGVIPPGADLYLLNGVLRSYDDADAAALLRKCRDAMPERARLVVVERLMPDRAPADPESIMLDLHMMTITGGRLRSLAEIEALLAAAGLSSRGARPLASGPTAIEAVRTAPSPE